ncbi:MAG: Trk system potassium transporter TrkA [Lachnospiraceae bacterium]|nr:Trk system potassium transporter TrkA [Lachnospiraceae bacterium]
MKIVIVGGGKVGNTLASQLSKENHDIVVIDNNISIGQRMVEQYDIMSISGNGASVEIQKEADVGKSDLLIAVTSADEINILCCILARKLGCKHTIARVRNPEYTQQMRFLKEELGLSMAINPERTAAREIYRIIRFPSFLKLDSFARGIVELVEIKIKEDSILNGKRLGDYSSIVNVNSLVCVVEREGEAFIPKGNFELKADDKITVTAATNDLPRLIKTLGIEMPKVKNVMIIGGSRIAVYLAERLIQNGIDVKIIEQSFEKCKYLSERLPEALIINGDGTLQDTLISEDIKDTDAVVSLMNFDEGNILISIYAEYVGVKKTITKINRIEYKKMFNSSAVDTIVSPKLISANEIIRYVRSMVDSKGGSVLAMHQVVNDKAEGLEFLADKTTKYLGEPFHNLPIKENVLVACIARDGNVIIPKGDDYIYEGDSVIIVTSENHSIFNLNDIFTE